MRQAVSSSDYSYMIAQADGVEPTAHFGRPVRLWAKVVAVTAAKMVRSKERIAAVMKRVGREKLSSWVQRRTTKSSARSTEVKCIEADAEHAAKETRTVDGVLRI